MSQSIASAPGKIMWLGGYTILEKPNIALVTTIDKRVYTSVQLNRAKRIILHLPQVKLRVKGEINDGRIRFEGPLNSEAEEKIKFVKMALEFSMKYLTAKNRLLAGMSVTTVSDPVFGFGHEKTGLGSSAAVTVATVAAVLNASRLDVESNKDTINKIAQLAHSNAQGRIGSGFDVAAATFGSCIYSTYSPLIVEGLSLETANEEILRVIEEHWDYSVRPITLPPSFFMVIASTGEPASTSKMVKQVLRLKDVDERKYIQLTSQIDEENRKVTNALIALNQLARDDPSKYASLLDTLTRNRERMQSKNDLKMLRVVRESFVKGRVLTKELGRLSNVPIEPEKFTEVIQLLEKNGAFVAKLPGSGGGDSIATLCLSEANTREVREVLKSSGLRILSLTLGDEGVRRENVTSFGNMLGDI